MCYLNYPSQKCRFFPPFYICLIDVLHIRFVKTSYIFQIYLISLEIASYINIQLDMKSFSGVSKYMAMAALNLLYFYVTSKFLPDRIIYLLHWWQISVKNIPKQILFIYLYRCLVEQHFHEEEMLPKAIFMTLINKNLF